MMHQTLNSSKRKNRDKKINRTSSQNSLDSNSSSGYFSYVVKKPVSYIVSLFHFGFVLVIFQKVFHSLQFVKNKTSRLALYRMVSQEYWESKAMASKSSTSQPPKPASTVQPTRLEVDPDLVEKYEKEIENMTEEKRLESFNQEKSLGNDCFKKCQYKEAVHHYTYCILSQPHSMVGYANRAAAFLKLNKYSQVLEDCNEVLKRDANHTKAKYRRGLALHHKNFFKEALQDFEDVVRNERNLPDSKSCATAKHYVYKIRELLYTQPREIRLQVNDINGNSSSGRGEGYNMKKPHIICVPEKDYRYNPKYQRCVPITEWGLAKAWCKCHNGEPEFVRSFSRELAQRRRHSLLEGKTSGANLSSNTEGTSTQMKTSRDHSVNILAEGLRKSLGSNKPTNEGVKSKSILESTLRPPNLSSDSSDSENESKMNADSESNGTDICPAKSEARQVGTNLRNSLSKIPIRVAPPVPNVRSMPLLDDEEDVEVFSRPVDIASSVASGTTSEVDVYSAPSHNENLVADNTSEVEVHSGVLEFESSDSERSPNLDTHAGSTNANKLDEIILGSSNIVKEDERTNHLASKYETATKNIFSENSIALEDSPKLNNELSQMNSNCADDLSRLVSKNVFQDVQPGVLDDASLSLSIDAYIPNKSSGKEARERNSVSSESHLNGKVEHNRNMQEINLTTSNEDAVEVELNTNLSRDSTNIAVITNHATSSGPNLCLSNEPNVIENIVSKPKVRSKIRKQEEPQEAKEFISDEITEWKNRAEGTDEKPAAKKSSKVTNETKIKAQSNGDENKSVDTNNKADNKSEGEIFNKEGRKKTTVPKEVIINREDNEIVTKGGKKRTPRNGVSDKVVDIRHETTSTVSVDYTQMNGLRSENVNGSDHSSECVNMRRDNVEKVIEEEPAVRTQTKASKRHMRRKMNKLNKQSQDGESVS